MFIICEHICFKHKYIIYNYLICHNKYMYLFSCYFNIINNSLYIYILFVYMGLRI